MAKNTDLSDGHDTSLSKETTGKYQAPDIIQVRLHTMYSKVTCQENSLKIAMPCLPLSMSALPLHLHRNGEFTYLEAQSKQLRLVTDVTAAKWMPELLSLPFSFLAKIDISSLKFGCRLGVKC